MASLDAFLDSKDADSGLQTDRARMLVAEFPGDEDAAYKFLVNVVRAPLDGSNGSDGDGDDDEEEEVQKAARSYRAMTMLKQDLSNSMGLIVKNPAQAGLLAKEVFAALSVADQKKRRFSTLHLRELLDALLEAYPEKIMSAASAGGKQGIEEHLGPLLTSDQTLPALTHLVCYGCTGRKGIASAEKSAQHTAQLMRSNAQTQISMGARRKFVYACDNFGLLDRLALALSDDSFTVDAGEEVCEAVLTIIELIGYPPDEVPSHMQQNKNANKSKDEISVGEDVLLSPLTKTSFWSNLLEALQRPSCTLEQRLAISRTCMQTFALTTGNSSRICKSHAPATDMTEQTSESIIEEKEDVITNRLIEWGLTDKIHGALIAQLPALIEALHLPDRDILGYEATFITGSEEESERKVDSLVGIDPSIRHPGRYKTTPPLGSWRLHLLSLLKEIVVFRGSNESACRSHKALDAIMELPLPKEFLKSKKGGGEEKVQDQDELSRGVFNPWPALCSYLWAYPHNDFYAITFFEMLRSAVVEHHEATLRIVLQKSKFVSRAVRSLETPHDPLHGVLVKCFNLLRLRSHSLPPSIFLPQYLNSHDGWKSYLDKLVEVTLLQQTPIKSIDTSKERLVMITLGSDYAKELGLGGIDEYDAASEKVAKESTLADDSKVGDDERENEGTKKNKKKKNKKKK